MKNTSNIIPICFICDKGFIMPTCVAITSMLVNKKNTSFYHIFIICVNCKEDDFECMNHLEEFDNFKIEYRVVSDLKYKSINQKSHITKACLIKFEISDIITEYDKMIYLDGDIIIQDDLTDFYNLDLGNSYLAGPYMLSSVIDSQAGMVMGSFVINSKKMREINASQKLIEHRLQQGDTPSMDGVSYNEIFRKNMKATSFSYGLTVDKLFYDRKYYSLTKLNAMWNTNYKSREQMLKNAAIIHYTGGGKPWKYKCFHGVAIWDKYYNISPYRFEYLNRIGLCGFLAGEYKKYGIRGIWYVIKDRLLEILGSLGIHYVKYNGYGWY